MKLFNILLILLVAVDCFASKGIINLNPNNTATLRGEVNESSVREIELKIVELNQIRGDKQYPIYLVLDTPGGEVDSGLSLIEFLKSIRDLNTITLFAASMGSAIQQGVKGTRYGTETQISMFHRARGTISGYFEDGEMESRLKMAKDIVRGMEKNNASRIGISLEEYKKKVKDEWWIVGDSAIKEHVLDEVVDIHCSNSLVEKKEYAEVQVFIFSMKVEYSSCPLIRSGKPVKEEKDPVQTVKE